MFDIIKELINESLKDGIMDAGGDLIRDARETLQQE